MKLLEAVLAGMPIVTTQWIDACLSAGKFVMPTKAHCINTVPIKARSDSNEPPLCEGENDLAVFKAAASMEMSNKGVNLFGDTNFILVGRWDKNLPGTPPAEDVEALLKRMGGKVIADPKDAATLIYRRKKGCGDTKNIARLVLLCDDTESDAACGMNGTLHAETQNLIGECGTFVQIAHFLWAFDSIVCYRDDLPYNDYPPRAKFLNGLFTVLASLNGSRVISKSNNNNNS